MTSDLERIAEAVRHLADAKGQVRPYLTRAAEDARRTASSVPSGVPSATATTACLHQASVSLQRVVMLLESFADDAARFADGLAGGGASASVASAQAGGSATATSRLPEVTLPAGFSAVALDDIEEIDPNLEYQKGYSEADLAWAVNALHDVVVPGIQNGLTLSDFRDMDMQLNQWGTRSYADTYSGFFGDASIVLDRGEGERSSVSNGRHRIQAARRAGLTWLPARRPPSTPA